MKQHPVPQNIASYEFRLVGDMTLKQFFQVAGGALIALLFYASPLPGFIKWPAILLFGIAGVAFAFLPFEERPLSMWSVAFLRAIYSPTKYAWEKGKVGELFAADEVPVPASQMTEGYLEKPAASEENVYQKLETEEKNFFQKALSLFSIVKLPGPASPASTQVVQRDEQPTSEAARPQMIVEQEAPTVTQLIGVTPPPPPPPPPPSSTPPPLDIRIAGVGPIFIPHIPKRGVGRPRLTTPGFQISANPPPSPGALGIIVGQVLDKEDNVVDGAILEIRDSEGRPTRALRTNKVGHFLTATSLVPGIYQLITEKEGLEFDPVQIEVKDEIIPPIEIKARSTKSEARNNV